jgi:hypothetical protein
VPCPSSVVYCHHGCLVVVFYVTAKGGCDGSFLHYPFHLLAYAESTAAVLAVEGIYAAVSAVYHGIWCVYTERSSAQ